MASPIDPFLAPHRTVERTLREAIGIPGAVGLILAGFLAWAIFDLVKMATYVDKLDQLNAQAHHFEKLMVDEETGMRGYQVTGIDLFLEPMEHAETETDDAFTNLSRQAEMIDQKARVPVLRAHFLRWKDFAETMINYRRQGDPHYLDPTLNARGKQLMDGLRGEVQTLVTVCEALRDQREREVRTWVAAVVMITTALAIVGVAILGVFTRKRVRDVAREYERASEEQFQDSLTGLFNRRGFLTLSHQQILLAVRSHQRLTLFYFDLDGLKQINDTLGHHQGSQALVDFADVLRLTFRTSDTLARLGGDEFAALATHSNDDTAGIIKQRLESNLTIQNGKGLRPFKLRVSTGSVAFDADSDKDIEVALMEADAKMYVQKRKHHKEAGVPDSERIDVRGNR